MRIVIAEDAAVIRAGLAEILADRGHEVVAAVGDELQSITTEATSALIAVRTLFIEKVLDTSEAEKRKFVFLSQLQAQPTISWVAFGWPDDAFFAAHKLGDLGLDRAGDAQGGAAAAFPGSRGSPVRV